MDEIYLKIYVDNGNTIVFEGQGTEDKNGYYPTRWDDVTHRLGTVVVGKEHITITDEAKQAFQRIVREAHHTGDDLSCLDIHTCYGRNKDGSMTDRQDSVCVSYLGDVVTKWNIEDVIHDEEFFIGTGEGFPQVSLLNALILDD